MPETQPSETERDAPTSAPTTPSAPAAASAAAPATPVLPKRLVFRVSGAALVGVAFFVLCESVVTFASVWLTLLYLLPLGIAYWLVRTRTVVDADAIVIRRAFTRKVLPWSEIASLRVTERKWVRAVRADGSELTLPSVHTRHLPALAIVSGGRLTDPTEPLPADTDTDSVEDRTDIADTADDQRAETVVEPDASETAKDAE